MSAPRVNIYGFPHKGLKNGLSQLLHVVGKTDITNAQSVKQVKLLANELINLLELHQDAEDSIVLPALEARVKGSTAHNHLEHDRLHAMVKAISGMVDGLSVGNSAAEMARLFDAIGAFYSDYLRHMSDEEGEINAVIWEHFADDEILEWQGQIMDKLTPEQKMSWFKFIVPALNPMERSIMLGGVKENVPIEAYRAILEMLSDYMSEEELAPLAA